MIIDFDIRMVPDDVLSAISSTLNKTSVGYSCLGAVVDQIQDELVERARPNSVPRDCPVYFSVYPVVDTVTEDYWSCLALRDSLLLLARKGKLQSLYGAVFCNRMAAAIVGQKQPSRH